jgi:hypothetical protein
MVDPYRIIIKLPGYQYQDVLEALKNMNPETMNKDGSQWLPRPGSGGVARLHRRSAGDYALLLQQPLHGKTTFHRIPCRRGGVAA